MKRFLIPAFFVIDVADNENVSIAQELAAEMQHAANELQFARTLGEHRLMMDEEVLDRKVPILSEETELPHTFNWNPPNTPGHLFADCGGSPRCTKCGCDEDDAYVGGQPCVDEVEELQENEVCPNCGSELFNDKGECQKCGL